jgi:pimeloyl-ACP methyl ester carboxylesterase
VFRSVVMMSAPFGGPPALPFDTVDRPATPLQDDPVHRALAALPRPRKHYQWYYSTREANADMQGAAQGVHDFLRAYYHHKSADWRGNQPHPLQAWSADELATLPTYYVMDLAESMAQTVAKEMPDAQAIAGNGWLPDSELAYYSAEYQRTGFQGGLQWYRCGTSGAFDAELQLWSGLHIDVPAAFIAGRQDWGIYQRAGVFEAMQTRACTNMMLCELVDGAGHWVQQEQPDAVNRLLLAFLARTRASEQPSTPI